MKYAPVTIKDIAKALNYSTSTISRALRGSYEIGEETRKIILDYAEKINYRPNPIALSLRDRRSKSIAVLVSEIANNFFSEAINGIESIAYYRGYHVIITQSHESAERERTNVLHHASRSVDGLLISLSSGTRDLSYLKNLNKQGLPLVFFDRITDEIQTNKVTADNYHGAFQATEHLIQQGFKRIAHITSAPHLSISKERLRGYRDALIKNHLPVDESLIRYCDYGGVIAQEVEDALTGLFRKKQKPDAIFTAGDRLTTSCFGLLKKMNKAIFPGFIGFSNTRDGELFTPGMSVVKQPAIEIGQVATEMLINMIESKRPPTEFRTEILSTELIIRKSSLNKVQR